MRIILALALILHAPIAMAQTLRSADVLPADHPSVEAVQRLSQVLREQTNGRLYIQDLGADSPHSESFLVAQVRIGLLDIARVNLNALNGIADITAVPALPFVFASKAEKRRALDGKLGQELLASLEPVGLVGLALYDSGTYSFFSRTGFIKSVEDLRGKRLRVQKGDTSEAIFRKLGAQPVTVPQLQIFGALQTGIIDVVEGNLGDYLAFNYYTVAPYFTVSQHAEPPSVLIMSRQKWLSLSKEDRDLLRDASAASVKVQRELMDEYETRAKTQAAATSARFSYDFDHQSFREAVVPLYPLALRDLRHLDWLKRLATDEVLADPLAPTCRVRPC